MTKGNKPLIPPHAKRLGSAYRGPAEYQDWDYKARMDAQNAERAAKRKAEKEAVA